VRAKYSAISFLTIAVVSITSLSHAQEKPASFGEFNLYACMKMGCDPFKIIDPADLRFNAKRFHFEDYPSEADLDYAISHLIRPGMTRDQVEAILVNAGKATVGTSTDANASSYTYPDYLFPDGGLWVIRVFYENGDRVQSVWVSGKDVTLTKGFSLHPDPKNFKFEDYMDQQSRMDVLKNLFPLGTEKDFVEKVLIQIGGATSEVRTRKNELGYIYKPKYPFPTIDADWNVTVYYDEQSKVQRILMNGFDVNKPLYSKEQ
jgi:hypothetical protein